MFKFCTTGEDLVLPAQATMTEIEQRSWYRAFPLNKRAAAKLQAPDSALEELARVWLEGPTKKVSSRIHWLNEKFVAIYQHEADEGFVYFAAKFLNGETVPGILVFDEEDDPKPMFELFAEEGLEDPKPDDVLFMKELWAELPEPVTQIIAQRQQRPNDKCACGSGKKFKKCCQ